MKAALLLAPGFEDAEAIIICDILRRAKIHVDLIACAPQPVVISYFAIPMQADRLLSDVERDLYDAVIIPGGPAATQALAVHQQALKFIQRHDNAGKWVCALCSAAARVLGGNGLLKGRHYTCSGDLWQKVNDGIYQDQDVVIDGNLISGRGLGKAFDFAFTVAERLAEDRHEVYFQADHIYHPFTPRL